VREYTTPLPILRSRRPPPPHATPRFVVEVPRARLAVVAVAINRRHDDDNAEAHSQALILGKVEIAKTVRLGGGLCWSREEEQ